MQCHTLNFVTYTLAQPLYSVNRLTNSEKLDMKIDVKIGTYTCTFNSSVNQALLQRSLHWQLIAKSGSHR